VSTGPVQVLVDRLRLRQIMTNLLSNAARFTPAGTPIDVTVTTKEDWFEVRCEDRGPGIPSERRGDLFQRFSRLGEHTPGMGLGLFLSREIARAHGGDLTFRERSGGGACFVLRLPTVAAVTAKSSSSGS
jgi:two-component system sensor histidine kinase KdpD